MNVEVPEAFRRIGYSGLFHIEIAIPPEHLEAVRAGVPHLMKTRGWMCAAVTDDDKAVLVRHDAHALVDIFLGHREMPS